MIAIFFSSSSFSFASVILFLYKRKEKVSIHTIAHITGFSAFMLCKQNTEKKTYKIYTCKKNVQFFLPLLLLLLLLFLLFFFNRIEWILIQGINERNITRATRINFSKKFSRTFSTKCRVCACCFFPPNIHIFIFESLSWHISLSALRFLLLFWHF